MAIAKIKKLEIIGLQEDRDKLLALLQRLGMVELIKMQALEAILPMQAKTNETELLEMEEAISFLADFQAKKGLLEGITGLKPSVFLEQLKEVIAHFDYRGFLKGLSELKNRLKALLQQREKLSQELTLLYSWRNLSILLDEIRDTKVCAISLGILRPKDYANLLEDCEKKNLRLFSDTISEDKAYKYLVFIYLKEDFQILEEILKNYHFSFTALPRYKGRVSERLSQINNQILAIDEKMQAIKSKITSLSSEQFKLMIVYDYLSNNQKRQDVDKILSIQRFTFTLSGWIRQKDIKLLERHISDEFKDVAVFISDPAPGEVFPVDLENRDIIQPFEFITKIYGMPKYNEIDPTPFLAPFFFLYFGLCISDVGYGLMLIFICWFALKRFKLGPQGWRFFRLFLFCGISTVIIGALTGSWFGNLWDLLAQSHKIFLPFKRFKDSLVILDPLKQPTKLLGIALCLGIVQVWFGNIVAAIGNLKNKRYLDILFDQVPMLTFLFGLTGLGLIFLGLLDKTHVNLFKYAAVFSALVLILTQGRAEKGMGAKLFYGVYYLYSSLSGYLSDVLSYSRLWALGLVTGVMANTINLISVQFSQILVVTIPILHRIYFIKILVSSLVLIIIFIAGHLVSFLMSLLGAFVHPVRLQFVEFFSKFFRAGGKPFRPFKIETKYVNIG